MKYDCMSKKKNLHRVKGYLQRCAAAEKGAKDRRTDKCTLEALPTS